MLESADGALVWLLTPIDATRAHHIAIHEAWHGRAMFLAWGVLLPLGVLIARYFKITPNQKWPDQLDNRFWWYSHLFFQHFGLLLMLVGLVMIVQNRPFAWPSGFHGYFGWTMVIGGLLQGLSGYLRGTKGGPTDLAPDGSLHGDHFDMTPRRIWFERFHKSMGYGLIVGGLVGVISGLWHTNAPKWMWLTIVLFWCGMIATAIICERRGMQISSYEAIWGRRLNR